MMTKIYKPSILSLITEEVLNESVQEYVSESGKSSIKFENNENNSEIKITTKLIVDMDVSSLPADYQTTFIELMEMIELQWNDLVKKWYEGDLSKAAEEIETDEELEVPPEAESNEEE